MVPGLVSKPPLPKKPDLATLNLKRKFIENNNEKSMDAISAYLSLKYQSNLPNADYQVVCNADDRVEDDHFEKLVQKRNKRGTKDSIEELRLPEKLNRTDPDRDSNDYLFQSWIEEERIARKELETDKYLEKLKLEHGLTDKRTSEESKKILHLGLRKKRFRTYLKLI